jgi:RND family efflux transporter MFP subunit
MVSIVRRLQGWKLPIIGCLALAFAVFTVATRKPNPPKDPIVPPPAPIYASSVAGIGIVEPKSELISIGSDIPGVVRQVYVKVNAHVKAGTPLFSLDQRDSDAEVAALEATLKSAQIQAQDATSQFETVWGLSDKRAVSKDEYTRRQFAAQAAKSRVAEIQAQLHRASTTRDRLTVRAPISGQILAVNIRPGEFAATTAAEPLIRMGDTSTLYVRVEIDEQNAHDITPSASATATLRGDVTQKIPLKFVRFEPYVKPKVNLATGGQRVDSRVLQIIYAISAKDDRIFVGQQMDVFIERHAQ